MSKLNSDNRNTMPITDAVYGGKPKRAEKPERPRRGFRAIGDALVNNGQITLIEAVEFRGKETT